VLDVPLRWSEATLLAVQGEARRRAETLSDTVARAWMLAREVPAPVPGVMPMPAGPPHRRYVVTMSADLFAEVAAAAARRADGSKSRVVAEALARAWRALRMLPSRRPLNRR
jgi:hypothetical protein